METLSALLAAIPQPDVAGMARAQQHIDGLLKPPGSLGRLETLAVQLAGLPGLQGQLALAEKAIVVMCADHGVWHEGVTPSPQGVTAIHAGNMVRGNTGVCVLAAQAGARVQVVDVGIDADIHHLHPGPGLRRQHADAGVAPHHIAGMNGRHPLRRRGHAFMPDAMVGAHDHNRFLRQRQLPLQARQTGQLHRQRLQTAKAAGRL